MVGMSGGKLCLPGELAGLRPEYMWVRRLGRVYYVVDGRWFGGGGEVVRGRDAGGFAGELSRAVCGHWEDVL